MPSKKPKPSTYRLELERLALAAFTEARKKRDEARELDKKARRLKATSASIDRRPLDPALGSGIFQRSLGRVKHKSKFRLALMKRKLTLAEWVRRQDDPPLAMETAKSWFRMNTDRPRQIPMFWAKKIAAEFVTDGVSEVPAVDASWPHGIARS
jgi:hypothetical protein